MINAVQAARMQRELRGQTRGNGDDGPAGDMLERLFEAACVLTDPDDIVAAWDDLRSIAVRGYDEADGALRNAEQNAEDARGDALYHEMKERNFDTDDLRGAV